MSPDRVTVSGIERLQPVTVAPVILDAKLLASLQRVSDQFRGTAAAIERMQAPLRSLGTQLAAVAELEPRRRQLVARLGTRHAHAARGIERLPVGRLRQLLDAIEHGHKVDAQLSRFVAVIRDALTGHTVTRRGVRQATRRALGCERRPRRHAPDRRGDHRPRIEAGCTSRPRAPGFGSAQLRETAAPARRIPIPRGLPV